MFKFKSGTKLQNIVDITKYKHYIYVSTSKVAKNTAARQLY